MNTLGWESIVDVALAYVSCLQLWSENLVELVRLTSLEKTLEVDLMGLWDRGRMAEVL